MLHYRGGCGGVCTPPAPGLPRRAGSWPRAEGPRPGSRCPLSPAREIQEEELRRFASRVAALLQGPELGPEAVDLLQRLHLAIAATKYPRK